MDIDVISSKELLYMVNTLLAVFNEKGADYIEGNTTSTEFALIFINRLFKREVKK